MMKPNALTPIYTNNSKVMNHKILENMKIRKIEKLILRDNFLDTLI